MSDIDEGNVNGELISEPNINSAVVGVAYASPEGADATGGITVDGLTATVTIVDGNPDEQRNIVWGDGTVDPVTLSDVGAGSGSHTYAAAGDYLVTGTDSAGNPLTSEQVTVTAPAARGRKAKAQE